MPTPATLLAPPTAAVPFAADLARHGDALALVHDDESLTYAELADRVGELAARLGTTRRLVAVTVRNDVASIVAYLAALAGGHPVVLAPADRPEALDPILATYRPDVVVHAGRSAGLAETRLDERHPGTAHDLHPDLALLLSTSGSTGSPKLVRLSQANLQANAEAIADSLGITPADRAVTTLPMHYCYGLSVIHSHLARGATLVLTTLSVVDPCFWDLVRRARGTSFAAVPYTFDLLDRVGFPDLDLPSLRYVTQAGGRLAPETVRRYAELGAACGWDLVVMYGQTEATARMGVLPPGLAAEHPGTIGVPVPGGAFRIEPVDGHDAGELVYAGPNVMLGYAESPADLALGRTVDELRTGDLARQRPDGLYEIVGRRSRFLKLVGLRVDLARVEEVLAELGLVERGLAAAATGTDERLVVAVERASQADPDDDALVSKVLAERLGLPRAAVVVHGVSALPRLASGKTDYAAVLALDAARRGPAGDTRPADALAQLPGSPTPAPVPATQPTDATAVVRRIYAEELEHPHVTDDDTFVGLEGDSLSYVATSVRLEQALGHLPADWHVTPIRDLVPRPATPASPLRRRLARLAAPIETGIVLRALAIVLIVGTHAKLFAWPGTAHVLIALAGYNFARFQLGGERLHRLRRQLRSLARIVVPSVAFIGAAYLLTDRYSLANVVLLNAVVGPETWSTTWQFWFVEVLVYLLVGLGALLATPWGDRVERRFPFGLPVAILGAGLLTRFEVVDPGVPHTAPVLWLFALGWALSRTTTTPRRLALSVVALVSVPGFFDDPRREAVVLAGLLLLAWVPTVRLPAVLHRPLGVLASASLYAYLVQWLVYPELVGIHPAVAVVASLVAGVAYWGLVTRVPALVRRRVLTRRTVTRRTLTRRTLTRSAGSRTVRSPAADAAPTDAAA
ncbi:AMP-binding protein [Cellulomonas fimi]|uniref:AMP-binding protein n=1 Tax=Cellulomonas fimi TaxID=1708 RepID=A0A7Y0M068_CELFI|nr:AMP-binding protein [Cellulomonas fimi]NMR20989.1 AMP-binding protein [Cellulomonas fimi]